MVGASTTCTATYTLDQDDVDNEQVDNLATADTDDPNGDPVTDTDTETVTLPAAPSIEILKSGVFNDTNTDGNADAGETITYTSRLTSTTTFAWAEPRHTGLLVR